MRRAYCVYEHWRLDENEVFYVGKGSENRAKNCSRPHNPHYQRIVEKLASWGVSVLVHIALDGLTEEEAFAFETALIKHRRAEGHRLVNMTDGGEGTSGYVFTLEHSARLSVALKGIKRTAETRAKMSAARRATMASPEARAKLSAAVSAAWNDPVKQERPRTAMRSPEYRAKISAASKRTYPENRAKLLAAIRGRKLTSDQRAKLLAGASAANRRRVWTPEMRAKLSAAHAARWADPEFRAQQSERRKRSYTERTKREHASA
jgi:hypothetical protein